MAVAETRSMYATGIYRIWLCRTDDAPRLLRLHQPTGSSARPAGGGKTRRCGCAGAQRRGATNSRAQRARGWWCQLRTALPGPPLRPSQQQRPPASAHQLLALHHAAGHRHAQPRAMEEASHVTDRLPLTELGVGAALLCELEHAGGGEGYLHFTTDSVKGHYQRQHPSLPVPGRPALLATFQGIAETLSGLPPLLMSSTASSFSPAVDGGAVAVPHGLVQRGHTCPSCGYVAVRKANVAKHIKESAGRCASNSKPEPCTLLLPGKGSQPRRIILTPPPPRRASTAARVASAVATGSPARSQARPQPADAESPPRRGREPLPRATQPASLCESA